MTQQREIPQREQPALLGSQLTAGEQEILQFERQWFRHAGTKEDEIRRQFDISATRYYQLLNALLDKPGALAAAPQVVARLRRLRAARQRSRYSGRGVLRHR